MICYKERNLSFCTLYEVWGDDFHIKFQIFEKKIFILFYFIDFFYVLLLLNKP